MKRSPILIAFLQVLAVVAYILVFAFAVNNVPRIFNLSDFDQPMVGMTFFLLAFVTSALICGSLILGYPIYLFLGGEKRQAVMVVLWSVCWFIAALLLLFLVVLLIQSRGGYVFSNF